MVEIIKEFLLEHWQELFPFRKHPGQWRFLLIKGNLGGYGGNSTFLIFSDQEAKPFIAVKTSRDPKYEKRLEQEYIALRYLRDNLPEDLSGHIPQAYYVGHTLCRNILIEEAVSGKSLDAIMKERALGKQRYIYSMIEMLSTWLIDLQKEICNRGNLLFGSEHQYEDLSKQIDSFSEGYLISEKEESFLDYLKQGVVSLKNSKVPLPFEHRDFSPINIILANDKFWVIDWVDFKREGLPLQDVFYFLLWLNFSNYSSEKEFQVRLKHFFQMFFRNGKHSRIATKIIKRYCDAFGIDLAYVKIFLALFLITRGIIEYELFLKQSERGFVYTVQPLGRGTFYKDGSLLKSGLYINLFRAFVENNNQFIF